jgi:hypothetical protein
MQAIATWASASSPPRAEPFTEFAQLAGLKFPLSDCFAQQGYSGDALGNHPMSLEDWQDF